MKDTQEKSKQILKSWELFKRTDNSRMVNQKALEQAVNQIESLTAQLEEAKARIEGMEGANAINKLSIEELEKKQRIAIEALEFYADDNNYIIDVNYALIEVDEGDKAKQALSTIRGEKPRRKLGQESQQFKFSAIEIDPITTPIRNNLCLKLY